MTSYDDDWMISLPHVEPEAGDKNAKEESVVENTTPDYAAGLVSAQVSYCCFCFKAYMAPFVSFYFNECPVVLVSRNSGH